MDFSQAQGINSNKSKKFLVQDKIENFFELNQVEKFKFSSLLKDTISKNTDMRNDKDKLRE
jgi:serine/threonine-protein kinase RIO1